MKAYVFSEYDMFQILKSNLLTPDHYRDLMTVITGMGDNLVGRVADIFNDSIPTYFRVNAEELIYGSCDEEGTESVPLDTLAEVFGALAARLSISDHFVHLIESGGRINDQGFVDHIASYGPVSYDDFTTAAMGLFELDGRHDTHVAIYNVTEALGVILEEIERVFTHTFHSNQGLAVMFEVRDYRLWVFVTKWM